MPRRLPAHVVILLASGLLIVADACGEPLLTAPAADEHDAANAGDAADAGDEGCDPEGAFEPPMGIDELDSVVNDGLLTLTGDETMALFTANRVDGQFDIFQVTRPSRTAKFGEPVRVPEAPDAGIHTNDWDLDPTITSDGLRLVFLSGPSGMLMVATRATRGEPFGRAVPALAANDAGAAPEGFRRWPFLVADGTALYTHVDQDGVKRIERLARSDPFGVTYRNPVVLPELAGALTVVVDAAERRVFYNSRAPDPAAPDAGPSPRYRVWTATRASTNEPFRDHRLLTEVADPNADVYPSFVSHDGCRLYLGKGGKHYVAKRKAQ